MTALAENVDLKAKEGVYQHFKVQNGVKIYKGAPVTVDTDGYAQSNDGTTTTLANGDIFAGMAVELADNTDGSDADIDVRCLRKGIIEIAVLGTVTQAKVGDKVYLNNVSDDAAFTLTSDSGNPQITVGELVGYISSGVGLVDITGYVGNVAANGA